MGLGLHVWRLLVASHSRLIVGWDWFPRDIQSWPTCWIVARLSIVMRNLSSKVLLLLGGLFFKWFLCSCCFFADLTIWAPHCVAQDHLLGGVGSCEPPRVRWLNQDFLRFHIHQLLRDGINLRWLGHKRGLIGLEGTLCPGIIAFLRGASVTVPICSLDGTSHSLGALLRRARPRCRCCIDS